MTELGRSMLEHDRPDGRAPAEHYKEVMTCSKQLKKDVLAEARSEVVTTRSKWNTLELHQRNRWTIEQPYMESELTQPGSSQVTAQALQFEHTGHPSSTGPRKPWVHLESNLEQTPLPQTPAGPSSTDRISAYKCTWALHRPSCCQPNYDGALPQYL